VVLLVAGEDVGQRPHADLGPVGVAAAQPGLVFELPEQEGVRASAVLELRGQVAEQAPAEAGGGHVVVLLEPGQGIAVAAREAQRAIAEDALGVGHVAHDFLDAPLALLVAEVAFPLRQPVQEGQGPLELLLQEEAHVALGHQAHVTAVIGQVLAGIGVLAGRMVHVQIL
jgi:hypothetical protein